MTLLNSDRKVSWDWFWVEELKVQEIPPHCLECILLVWSLYLSTFFTFPLRERWRKVGKRKCIWCRAHGKWVPEMPLPYLYEVPYLNQAESNNRIEQNRIE